MIKEIPLKEHVKQFMLAKHGAEPIHINLCTKLGKIVQLAMHKLPFRQNRKTDKQIGLTLKIQLPTSLKHYTLTPEAAHELGEVFEAYFSDALIDFISGQVYVTQNEWAAIRAFHQVYGIDCDKYDEETSRKKWRDYKDRLLKIHDNKDLPDTSKNSPPASNQILSLFQ